MTKKVKNLILGGGFSGLYLLSTLDDALLIEKSPRLGGLLVGTRSGEFTFDMGGHVYTTSNVKLNKILTESRAIVHESRKAYFDYELKVGYPIQYDADKLGIEIKPQPQISYSSLGELLVGEFGWEFYNRVIGPFNRRVWSTDPWNMSAEWITGRVALMKEKNEKWGSNASFAYAPGNDIIGTMMRHIEARHGEYWLNTVVDHIDPENKEVGLVDGNIIQYQYLYDTTGLVLKRLKVDNMLPHNDVVTIGIGLNKKLDLDFHWWYNGVNNQSPIHRITMLSRYHPNVAPDYGDSLILEIPTQAANLRGVTSIAMRDLGAHGALALLRLARFPAYIKESDVAEVTYIRSQGYPIPIRGHRKVVAAARMAALEQNMFLIGRWGAHGYYNLEHLIADADAAIAVANGENSRDYRWANYYYKEKR